MRAGAPGARPGSAPPRPSCPNAAGSDSLASTGLHRFHHDDTYNPVEPATLLVWLVTLGFSPVTITVGDVLTFTARKPAREASPS
jgi:hypothetical protein